MTTAWKHDPFFQYPLNTVASSEGAVELPILYYDNSSCWAMFEADFDQASTLVAAQGLSAVRFAGNKALVAVAFYEYRKTAIGAYNEVGIAIAVVPDGVQVPRLPLLSLYRSLDKRHIGFHVIDLPVTTAAACAAGKEIWGYPKFVTPIDFSLEARSFHGTVADPATQHTMIELSGRFSVGLPAPQLDLVLYSRLGDQLLRTLVNTRGGGTLSLPGSVRLKVSDSAHPMAQRLIQLGLDNAAPKLLFHTHGLQLRLNAGAVLPGAFRPE